MFVHTACEYYIRRNKLKIQGIPANVTDDEL